MHLSSVGRTIVALFFRQLAQSRPLSSRCHIRFIGRSQTSAPSHQKSRSPQLVCSQGANSVIQDDGHPTWPMYSHDQRPFDIGGHTRAGHQFD